MKANELRIGNYVERDNIVFTVSQLRKKMINTRKEDAYSPITLTEKWLIDLGFKCVDEVNGGYIIPINYEHQNDFLYCSKSGIVALWNETNNREFLIMNKCKFVHQLQNLYVALTGKELKIKE